MKVLLINGSPHVRGCTYIALKDLISTCFFIVSPFISISILSFIPSFENKKNEQLSLFNLNFIQFLKLSQAKSNVSQVFNAETFIVGLLAGVMGIVITLLLLIPSNIVIHNVAGNNGF